jgi:hypothetical protein
VKPVPFLVHTADPGVHPGLTDDSDTKYTGPVTTVCDPVDPPARPATGVWTTSEPELVVPMFKFAVGCSPAAPPDHTLVTVTDPVWRVLVNVHTHTSPSATGTVAGPAPDTFTGLDGLVSSTQLIDDV